MWLKHKKTKVTQIIINHALWLWLQRCFSFTQNMFMRWPLTSHMHLCILIHLMLTKFWCVFYFNYQLKFLVEIQYQKLMWYIRHMSSNFIYVSFQVQYLALCRKRTCIAGICSIYKSNPNNSCEGVIK